MTLQNAYWNGYDAYWTGDILRNNPYLDREDRREWECGWQDAEYENDLEMSEMMEEF